MINKRFILADTHSTNYIVGMYKGDGILKVSSNIKVDPADLLPYTDLALLLRCRGRMDVSCYY